MSYSPTPKKQEKDVIKTMDFSQALIRVLKGEYIIKLEWGDEDIYGFLGDDGNLKIHRDGKGFDWVINDGDIRGRDWVVI